MCLGPPCVSCYLPFNFGISAFPEGYVTAAGIPDENAFRRRTMGPLQVDAREAYWTFANLHAWIAHCYGSRIDGARRVLDAAESRALSAQAAREERALRLYLQDAVATGDLLACQAAELYQAAIAGLQSVPVE